MLQTRKNQVLTSAAIKQMNVRHRELQFYMNSYWVWGSCCTVMEGFVFAQLVTPVPPNTELWLELLYLVFITVAGGLNLYIITVTTLCCVWGPAMAIRGAEGLRSVHLACDFMKDEQNWVYGAFLVSILSYFGFSMCLLSIWGWDGRVTVICNVVFTGFLVMLVFLLTFLFRRVGSSMIFDHSGAEGRIRTLDVLQDLADFDHDLHSRVPDVRPPSVPGMRELFIRGRSPAPGRARSPTHGTRHTAEDEAWQAVEHTPTSNDYARRADSLYVLEPGEDAAAAFVRIGDRNGEGDDENRIDEAPEAPGRAPDEANCAWLTRRPSPDTQRS